VNSKFGVSRHTWFIRQATDFLSETSTHDIGQRQNVGFVVVHMLWEWLMSKYTL
jgi:hypothetical protein